VAEIHYTTTLNDADNVIGDTRITLFDFTSAAKRLGIFDLTVGLHAKLKNNTLCRVGASVPLRENDPGRRTFDSEVQVQVERRF
jgi:hypothetical protein